VELVDCVRLQEVTDRPFAEGPWVLTSGKKLARQESNTCQFPREFQYLLSEWRAKTARWGLFLIATAPDHM
jgi:hypothetical protein